jgi:hypothetical protein
MRRVLLELTRIWLPLAIGVAGAVLIIAGHARASSPAAAAGVAFIIIALIVWLLNWLFRLSIQSGPDREREEAARRYYDEHGRWPDE